MQVLLIRTDRDGSVFWETFGEWDLATGKMTVAINAHLNTEGVTELRLIPG